MKVGLVKRSIRRELKRAEILFLLLFFDNNIFGVHCTNLLRSIIVATILFNHRSSILNDLNLFMFLVRTVNVDAIIVLFLLNLIVLKFNDLVVNPVCSPLLLAILPMVTLPIALVVETGGSALMIL